MPTWSPDPPSDDEDRYSGGVCRRCGCPLLEGEGRHCGGKNPDGVNCSAIVAREALAAAGGVRTYAQLRGVEE